VLSAATTSPLVELVLNKNKSNNTHGAKVKIARQNFEKHTNFKFHENFSIVRLVVQFGRTDGQADMTKLIVAFRNYANAPRSCEKYSQRIFLIARHVGSY
jgi:hypothetical protein